MNSIQTNDAFYFYQYIYMQHQSSPHSPETVKNMNLFLDLVLKTIENNLNILIPALFLDEKATPASLILYLKNDCDVMKLLLD